MARIEELSTDFNTVLNYVDAPRMSTSNTLSSTRPSSKPPPPLNAPTAAMPPQMAEIKTRSVSELLTELNRSPLFMTELDESDGAGGENTDLEALKALAYEGTKAEVASNFREQGNECAKLKRWTDARVFYNKAFAVLKGTKVKPEDAKKRLDGGEGPAQVDWLSTDAMNGKTEGEVVDEEAEREKERKIEEACYVNRALCNLELKNYRSCVRDCIAALTINPANIKALYRSSLALFSLSKLPLAHSACTRLLALDPSNTAATTLLSKIAARATALDAEEGARQARHKRKTLEAATLRQALKQRGIVMRGSAAASADAQDAVVALEDPVDAGSELRVPVLLLYPTHAQSDLIKGVSEVECLADHLGYILPPGSWDEQGEFASLAGVECFMETAAGGLMKVGKKIKLGKVLGGGGKVEVEDGLCRVFVVPKARVDEFVGEFKRRKG